MAKKRLKIPAYKLHPNGQAYVYHRSIDRPGHVIYLGKHGSDESLRRYRAFLKRLEATQSEPDIPAKIRINGESTIAELVAAYLQHCEVYYRHKSGEQTKEFSGMKEALTPVVELFGDDPASSFDVEAFEVYRQHLIQADYARSSVNKHANRVRRMYKWAVQKSYVSATVWHALTAVDGLKRGRTDAREAVTPSAVSWEEVEPVLPYLSPVVAAMVTVQFWCGMRPQDVCNLRRCDLDETGDVWIYTPPEHKNAWREHTLIKAIPHRVQSLISCRFTDDPTQPLFSPREAVAWRSRQVRPRKTKRYPSEERAKAKRAAIRAANPKHGDKYTSDAYRRAIEYGFQKLNVQREKDKLPPLAVWTPLQLRHGIATYLDGELGREASQKYLEHRNLSTTAAYVERTARDVIAIAREIDSRQPSTQ